MKDNKFKPKKNTPILMYGVFPPKDFKEYNPEEDKVVKVYGVFEDKNKKNDKNKKI